MPPPRKQNSLIVRVLRVSLNLFSSHFTHHSLLKNRCAFTLAEVLITLGIIGVVAAITISAIITNIQNKGYVEHMKKAYSIIQNVTNQIIDEEGKPSNWILDAYGLNTQEVNIHVVDMYALKMNPVKNCGMTSFLENACLLASNDYQTLDGNNNDGSFGYYAIFWYAYPLVLSDGSTIVLRFMSNAGAVFWGIPDLMFIVDVNGKNKPNKVGRDIFYFYMNKNENGKVHPYGYEQEDDCKKGDKGFSCAYKIMTEGKMNY